MSRSFSIASIFNPRLFRVLAATTCLAIFVGCGPTTEPVTDATAESGVEAAGDHEGHDHEGHSHSGKHGGHVVVLEPGHVHAEFVHIDDEDILEVYVDELTEAVTAVEVVIAIAGQDAKTYVLQPATESLGAGGYQLNDPLVLTGIQMADGTANKATLKVTTGSGVLTAEMTDDHQH